MVDQPSNPKSELDSVDLRLLSRLMRQGRATWSDLAEELGLTAPAIAQRVRRLEERGVIRQFAAVVSPDALAPVCAFVAGSASIGPISATACAAHVQSLEAVQECSGFAGADD
jgi:Lrp/AsnC family leucine-responsive transcriptional regulator